ncbi:MAG: glutamate--tRNA ligase [Bdellovibrionales bacterium]
MTVRTRFAPSPTGYLHIGNIKTAVLAWLYAHRTGGSFMLRIDDTDRERSKPEYEEAIKEDMTWMGLTWDRFDRESARFDIYADAAEKLKQSGDLYPCFETPDELALKRKAQINAGQPPLYDRGALKLSADDVKAKIAGGARPHWRFKLRHEPVIWDDLIQGRKEFHGKDLSDPVVIREDGVPLFTFCGIIDDIIDENTHVVRGEDHVSNTAVQIQIGQVVAPLLGKTWQVQFGHFPLMVTASGEEMSKRLGTMSIRQMRDEFGLEPMALTSVVATTGTTLPTDAYTSLDELSAKFDLSVVSKSGSPKFDVEDIRRINAKLVHELPFSAVKDRLEKFGLVGVTESFWNAVRPVLNTVREAREWWDVAHSALTPTIPDADFAKAAADVLPAEPWTPETFGQWAAQVKEKTGKKGKELFMPLRLALTGKEHGPEMNVLLPLIGRERAAARLQGKAA